MAEIWVFVKAWDFLLGILGSALITSFFWWLGLRHQRNQHRETQHRLDAVKTQNDKLLADMEVVRQQAHLQELEREGGRWGVIQSGPAAGQRGMHFDQESHLSLGSEVTESNPENPDKNA